MTGITRSLGAGLVCAGLFAGCAGLWDPFLGEAPAVLGRSGLEDGGGGGDAGPLAAGGDCLPSLFVRQGDDTITVGKVTTSDLGGVWGLDEKSVWAVGTSGTIVYWNGGGWRAEESKVAEQLRTIWGTIDSLYIVATNSVLLSRNSSGGWEKQQLGPTVRGLNDVHGAGGVRVVAADDGLVSWGTGATWQSFSTGITDAYNVRAVHLQSENRMVLGGIVKGTGNGFVNLYDGTAGAWTRTWAQSTEPGGINGALFVGDTLYTVSASSVLARFELSGSRTVVPHTFQQRFQRIRPSRTAGRFWVVGAYGQLLLSDGQTLVPRKTGTEADLYDAWEDPGGALWVVGQGGTILRCEP